MMHQGWMTTREILEVFADEITTAGGKVTETFDGERILYARSVLPGEREVRRGDNVQGGVALRATEEEIRVHPYVFRQVCKNGAIRAHAIQTRRILRADLDESYGTELVTTLREAVRMCCADEAFRAGAEEMRSALELDADMALAILPMMAHLPRKEAARILESILGRHSEGRDRSRFGLMNAVTSVARDTRDPELRWRLEELGGGIPIAVRPRSPRPDEAHATPAREPWVEVEEKVLV
jgi:hypothetical protein